MRAEGVLRQMVSQCPSAGTNANNGSPAQFGSSSSVAFLSVSPSLFSLSLSSGSLALPLSFTAAADFSFHLNQPLLHAQSPVSPFFLL